MRDRKVRFTVVYPLANLMVALASSALVVIAIWMYAPASNLARVLVTIPLVILNLFLAHRIYPRFVNPFVDWLWKP